MVCESCDSEFSRVMAKRVAPGEISKADNVKAYEEELNDADDDEVDDHGVFHGPSSSVRARWHRCASGRCKANAPVFICRGV